MERKTLGEHLRWARLDYGLLQRELARRLRVDPATIRNWELGKSEPAVCHVPGILRFLGYDPRQAPQTLAQRLLHHRWTHGLTQKALAARLGVDPSSLADWEKGRPPKAKRCRALISKLLARKQGRPAWFQQGTKRCGRGAPTGPPDD